MTAAVLALVAANVILWPRVKPGERTFADVSVLIPARNEALNLPACLQSVLQQAGLREVIVYDDHSVDGTASVVLAFARRDPRVRLLAPQPLPPGWCGKTFACQTLAEAASAEWLLFLDADAVLAQGALQAAVAEARRRNLSLLSCWPDLRMEGFWEKLLMPLLNFVVLTLFPAPLSALRPNDSSLGLAHGAFMLARRDAYLRVGGHAAVRGELFEDTLLARLWRRRGERSECLDGSLVVKTRMYGSLRQIWRGFEKNFFPAFRSPLSFWFFLVFHVFAFLVPFLLGCRIAAANVLAMRLLLAVRFAHPLWSVLLHPVAEALAIAIGLSSWWRYRHGGVEWKGRRYQAA